ncbi:MAG: replication initiation protein [Clostridiaceae bacterium]
MATDITNVGNNWVYQGNKLIESSYSFTVLEQKLIRLLASMIKKDDKDFKEYQFYAKDLSKLLNIDQKNVYREIDAITDKLMGRYIKIKSNKDEKFKKRHLIKTADFENGMLTMKIDEEMKDFYMELNWYTKYQLKNIMQFKSTYSFRLYELLKQYETIKSREIIIEDLRTMLDIGKTQYPKYANLKQKVIKVAIGEINEHTDLFINYEEIKQSRKVMSIKFFINNKSNILVLDEVAATDEGTMDAEDLAKQVQNIFRNHKITKKEAGDILKDADNNINLVEKCYEYALTKNDIKNIVGYVRKIVRAFNEPQKSKKVSKFTNYEQKEYDFDELERQFGY